MDPEVQKVLQWSPEAKTTKSSDHYVVTTPRYEVSSERLKWMEQEIFIAQYVTHHAMWSIVLTVITPNTHTFAVRRRQC